ncbi:MAG: D-tyrosyl-tRNA(Tyr) deacylase [Acidobacteria bacterium]|nr:D-tyrosyl-tRNA(Tyr) deacylase [Acidobacteriota bacterium]MBI3281849.1 D-tyrosyl-tRNA(Tyr) deacylase [Acidobacteriota bacterium]
MRALLQRVTEARVEVAGRTVGQIGAGLLVLLGIARTDTRADADYLVGKVLGLRIFEDGQGKMNLAVQEVNGALLVVPQFTLYGDCRKGRRPDYAAAAPPELARDLYEYFVERARAQSIVVETGMFQAKMSVSLVNDGPVTLSCDSDKIVKP